MIPGVCQKKGLTYRRFRVRTPDGRRVDHYIRLPDPTDPRFAAALAEVNRAAPKRDAPIHGTIRALVVAFRHAIVDRPLADATRSNYARYLGMIEADHGHRLVADLRPVHVYRIRDSMAATPGKANNYLNVLKQLLGFAAERDWRADNPATGVGPLAISEHQPWPADVLARALAAASPMLRLLLITGLCSGQRVSDVIRMQHNWHDGRLMQLSQKKTAKFVAIPMHPLWVAEIARHPRKAVTIMYDRTGKPFADTKIVQERVRRLMAEIGAVGYTFHGLRKNACCYQLELGLSDTEAGAILGMTPDTVRHYGKQARTLTIARGAADRLITGPSPDGNSNVEAFPQAR